MRMCSGVLACRFFGETDCFRERADPRRGVLRDGTKEEVDRSEFLLLFFVGLGGDIESARCRVNM